MVSKQVFSTPGNHDWIVPAEITKARFLVGGGHGGRVLLDGNPSGAAARGGRVREAVMEVTPLESLRLVVAGNADLRIGGSPDGGNGRTLTSGNESGGGGGSSSVRRGGTGLEHRRIVAGGGGGRGRDVNFSTSLAGSRNGGFGGASTGEQGMDKETGKGGAGGTQSSGGIGGSGGAGNGTQSSGGIGAPFTDSRAAGGGGGGGFWGGGGGGYVNPSTFSRGHGGGGGSNFVGSGITGSISSQGGNFADEGIIEVEWNLRPEVDATGPTGVITNTSRPTITWDYSDPDTLPDPQGSYRVQVFKDPLGLNELVYDSGWVTSGANEHTLESFLDNDEDYEAQVTVRQVASGIENDESNPDTTTFSLNLDAPAAPLFTSSPEPNQARIHLELDDPGTTELAAEGYTIEFRDSVDDSWVIVREATVVALPNPAVIYDYEAPFNRVREYRAAALRDVDGLIIASDWTFTQETLVMPYGATWITDVKEPDNIHFSIYKNPDRVRTWQGVEVVHTPVNMDLAIVETDETTPQDTISFFSTNEQEHDILVKIFKSTRILLYRDDRREHFYFRWVGGRTRSQIGDRRINADLFSGTQVLVKRPPS